MSEVLHQKYRPATFDEVYGQVAAVTALRNSVERRSAQAYLLSGPSGCGKTTLARITAHDLGCANGSIMEIDAATYTGIDAMRQVQDSIQYQPFGGDTARAVILDEAHRLSGNAWDSILKAIEEPPPDVFWFLCTTNPDKLPSTIKTRCLPIKLHELPKDELTDLIEAVCEEEDINLDGGIRQLIVSHAQGSPRQALVNLEACRDVTTREQAAKALDTVEAGDVTLQLCRLLAQGEIDWVKQIGPLWDKLAEQNPEGVRILITNYMANAAAKAKNNREVVFFLNVLAAFSTPYGQSDGKAMLLNSLGQCVFHD